VREWEKIGSGIQKEVSNDNGAKRKDWTFIRGKGVRTPKSKRHLCTEILTMGRKETSTGGRVWLLASRFKRRWGVWVCVCVLGE
jgi:hypothetical protein